MRTEPFEVAIEEHVLADLRERIARTRWPDPSPADPWEQGVELDHLRDVLAYWADGFDWRAREAELNRLAHFRAEVDGVWIHFVHEPGGGIPLVLTHGWPSTFAELLPLVPLLSDTFDVVIPSLPGYGFSERPGRLTTRDTARLWHRLMRGLGYERYGAQGGDFGAAVATYMALDDPDPLIGVHLHNLDQSPRGRPRSDVERDYVAARRRWAETERGYSSIQSTKPQTLAYGLNDSPAGLAAWILEKWRSWSDPRSEIPLDLLLTNVTLYWATGTIATSIRDYYDNRWAGTYELDERVTVPTGVAVFPHMLVSEGEPPREWAERMYDVRRWTPMPRGGHFAPAEQPELLARDIREFFAELAG